jgi:ARG and Rhodanese-Phosphatase-superfamily-associated Protein domain
MKLWHALVLAALLPACTHSSTPSTSVASSNQAPPAVDVAAGNTPNATPQARPSQVTQAAGSAMKEQIVGDPKAFDNLTIFPIYAKNPVDVGAMTTLDDALAKGKAEVREKGAGDNGGNAQVNTLVIENKGDVPIYVLAGTIVKGGNQDRQIGQDFIIESKQTVPVDAFCVEHGRWTGSRDGRATGGKFGTSQRVVTSTVRAAAQYKKNQSEVWDKVQEVNQAHHKSAASGTIFATLDSPEIEKKSAAIAEKINAFLKTAQPNDKLVGFAFAVDGQVKGARWFASHKVFGMFQGTLVNGVTLDALTAQAARNGAPPPPKAPPKSGDVVTFVDDVEKVQAAERRDTAAANANEYKESSKAYGSKAYRKPASGSPPAPAAATPFSSDYLAK